MSSDYNGTGDTLLMLDQVIGERAVCSCAIIYSASVVARGVPNNYAVVQNTVVNTARSSARVIVGNNATIKRAATRSTSTVCSVIYDHAVGNDRAGGFAPNATATLIALCASSCSHCPVGEGESDQRCTIGQISATDGGRPVRQSGYLITLDDGHCGAVDALDGHWFGDRYAAKCYFRSRLDTCSVNTVGDKNLVAKIGGINGILDIGSSCSPIGAGRRWDGVVQVHIAHGRNGVERQANRKSQSQLRKVDFHGQRFTGATLSIIGLAEAERADFQNDISPCFIDRQAKSSLPQSRMQSRF